MSVRFYIVTVLSGLLSSVAFCQYEILPANLDLSSVYNGFGVGLSVFDFDKDGLDDITICDAPWGIRAYRNNGDSTFVIDHVFDESGDAKCATWVDYDNDGDYDLFYTRDESYNRLFRNDGDEFTEVTEMLNPSLQFAKSTGCSWGDYDRDGFLDLYVCNYDSFGNRNWVYHNNGDGTFSEVSGLLGIHNNYNASFQSVWTDINLDGWQDLYVINDRLDTNRMYINTEGVFQDVSVAMGLDVRLNSMSNSVSDFDLDGDFDIYISNTPQGNYFMRNEGGVFIDVADELGLILNEWCWSGLWMDYDNDSDDDLHVATRGNPLYDERNPFFINDNGTFSKLNGYGLEGDEFQSTCAAKGDFNNDGKWDFAVNSQLPTCTNLWLNSQEETGHYIKLGLEGVVSNRDGVGSIIRCYHGGITNLLQTYCGENYMSQDSQYEIIGLGGDTLVDSLIVTWPSGWVDRYYNLEVDGFYGLLEGETFSATIVNSNDGYLCPDSGMVLLDAGDHQSYQWQDGSESRYYEVTSAGVYEVEVINSYGFVATAIYEVSVAQEIEVAGESTPVNCHGGNDGLIVLLLSQTVEEIIWNTGFEGDTLIDISSGVYSCTITDTLGCSYNFSFEISEPLPLEMLAQWDAISCYGGTTGLSVTTSGGTGEAEIAWGDLDPDQVAAGNYSITAEDSLGCISTLSIEVLQPDSLVLYNTTAAACYGESTVAEYDIVGGVSPYAIDWNGADETSLIAGSYDITITDGNNCIYSSIFEVTQTDSIIVNWTLTQANSGNNGAILLEVVGGTEPYEFNWSNGSTENPLEEIGQGYYQCFIVDSNGCNAISENIQIIDSGLSEMDTGDATGGWRVYPNPAVDFVSISTEKVFTGGIDIELFDPQGKLCLTKTLWYGHSPPEKIRLNLRELADGLFLMVIKVNGMYSGTVILGVYKS